MARNALSEYSAKRSFKATPEPPAAVRKGSGGPLLFVIQQHAARRLHYDFRLECDGVLKSWAVPKGPSLDPADKRLAVPTEDHPFDYGSFEGVIPPKQYGAGEVIVWDCGVYSPDEGNQTLYGDRAKAQREVREGLRKGKLSFQLRGEKVKGSFALVRTRDAKSWLLIKHKDRFVSTDDLTARDRSVLSGLPVNEMRRAPAERMPATKLVPGGKAVPMPDRVEAMHAELADAAFNKPEWCWEPKLDGYRVLAFVRPDGVTLRSRRGLDLSAAFPALVAELQAQVAGDVIPAQAGIRSGKSKMDSRLRGDDNDGLGMILDGELVAFDASGRPSFNALQNRVQLKGEREIRVADQNSPVVYCCFDLLYFGGVDLRDAAYADRRRYLAQCLLPSPLVQLVHATNDGVALHAAALASGFEGVMGKRKDSTYESGRRSPKWLKVKPTQSAEFVIGGYTKGKGAREALGALLVGYWDAPTLPRKRGRESEGALRYASHVGSGFDESMLKTLKKRLEPLRRETCPFVECPVLPNPTTWVKPQLVAELKFHEWTADGRLRAPVFLRLRDDLDAKTIRRHLNGDGNSGQARSAGLSPISGEIGEVLAQLESPKKNLTLAVGRHQIKLSNLDRVYWPADAALKQPALTKRDLLRYFAQVSPFILPHLADRPLTMIRMPAGIHKQRFFQKHWDQAKPDFVETITVWSGSKDESHQYLLCSNLPTLLWLAQSGTLEFHIWHSRAKVEADAVSKKTDYATSEATLEASVLNYPDYVVFDIDPYIYSGKEKKGAEPELNKVAFEKGKEIAFKLRELLESMGLEPIVKTSGKTGLHVFVPIKRTIDFDAVRHVSELVGRHLMRANPKDVTMEWSVPKRTGKIFMDYNMNVRGKTLNVAYSPRGVAGAPVSMPLTWDELASAHPLDFRITNVAQRLAETGDRWRDALKRKQSLERALKRGPG